MVRHSGQATENKTEYLSPNKKKEQKSQPGNCASLAHACGAEEWSLSVSHLRGRAGELNYYHMGPKGRKRTLLKPVENYGLPDLLVYKTNKGTATACKSVFMSLFVAFVFYSSFHDNCAEHLNVIHPPPPHTHTLLPAECSLHFVNKKNSAVE